MAAKSPQDLMAVQAALVQPAIEKSVSYGRHIADIANSTSAVFTKAVEGKVAESEKAVKSLVESSLKNAPAGSETAVAVMKSAVAAANNAFESMQKAVKQASDMAETNFKTAATTAMNATKTVAKKR